MNKKPYQDLVSRIFNYLQTTSPAAAKHVDTHCESMATLWLEKLMGYDLRLCEAAFDELKKIELKRFPQVGLFTRLINECRKGVKLDDGMKFGEYMACIEGLFDYKNMQRKKAEEMLSKIHLFEANHPEWGGKLDSNQKDICWKVALFLRFGSEVSDNLIGGYSNGLTDSPENTGENQGVTPKEIHAKNDRSCGHAQKLQTFL